MKNQDHQNTQQEIDLFKRIIVVKNFLTKTEIRRAEQILEVGEWNESDANHKQNEDGTFCKWMPLLDEYKKTTKNKDFDILDLIDLKVTNALSKHAINVPSPGDVYLKNCGIFSCNTAMPYYADSSYPIDANGNVVILGSPSSSGFSCVSNLDKVKAWRFRDGAQDLKYSCALFLNDNVNAGDLVFPEHQVEIRPERNKLVMFPSTQDYIHGERPISSGVKNCYWSWYDSITKEI
jgi:hypothetical protein